ncbi:serine/threonine-protein kinase meng-po-like [Cherax quadricarinatus]|uniref:serine/threonine-protein kinase meng-po-like n=1 Tax=Cherax quadricarinatus TaxID=27406 RepID=UPI0023787A47|nr:serine/threonine-protein kinase meng-po-like [Cherax quadricarinatus]XP_053628453.1 serine/threonine-protein kinase meng-po-like [Cherax quadricarinatus]XP_053628454.1 serine/threonine-protein kinase meng-po-like [Cherax quadricarinatus]
MLASVIESGGGGSCDLPEESLSDHYDILNILSYGRMGKIYLAATRVTGMEVVLKAVCRDMCRRRDVQREYHYASHLDHPNLTSATARLFQTDLYIVFPMEYAPYGDLGSHLSSRSIDEVQTRWVAEQVASALTYLHGFQLVHGSITPDNILIFRPNLSLVKVTDFGSTCRGGTFMRRRHFAGSYTPPELSRGEGTEGYYTGTSLDSWALGILIIHCLTGNKPWATTDASDPDYAAFRNWQRVKSIRVPRAFKRFTVRLLRLLRRLLEPHGWSRYPAKEVFKYLDDDWLIKSRDRSDSHDFSSSLVTLQHPQPYSSISEKLKDAQQDCDAQEQPSQGRVSSPRRFLAELLRFTSPTSSVKHRHKNHAWHKSSSSSSSSSSFSWLNSSSSTSSFSTSTNYSSV